MGMKQLSPLGRKAPERRTMRRAAPVLRLASLSLAAALALAVALPCRAATASPTMAISVAGRLARVLTPGAHISVVVSPLPEQRHDYCLGLISAIDRYGLPLNLGRLVRDLSGAGRVQAVIPARLFPAEPAGPFVLFVGTCTPIAPDRPFLARTAIHIVPSRSAR